jgi:hypothetical protein
LLLYNFALIERCLFKTISFFYIYETKERDASQYNSRHNVQEPQWKIGDEVLITNRRVKKNAESILTRPLYHVDCGLYIVDIIENPGFGESYKLVRTSDGYALRNLISGSRYVFIPRLNARFSTLNISSCRARSRRRPRLKGLLTTATLLIRNPTVILSHRALLNCLMRSMRHLLILIAVFCLVRVIKPRQIDLIRSVNLCSSILLNPH